MSREIALALLALQPGAMDVGEQEWTVIFRLDWASNRHALPVVVHSADRAEAEAHARRSLADSLIELAGRVACAPPRTTAGLPRLARLKFIGRRPDPVPEQAPA